jgi:PAS domain S-box-containing protein
MVVRRTAELTESRRQLSSLLADMPGAAYRSEGQPPYRTRFVSDGVLGLTGYKARDISSGEVRWDQLMHPDDMSACQAKLGEALAAGRSFELEYRIRHADGTLRHVWDRGHPVAGPDGQIRWIEGLVVDATDRKAAEARTREFDRQLLETQKLESLGVLAGGIAHDFNNLLTSVLGNASLARLQLPPGGGIKPLLDQIEVAARRAADLCAQMLAYAGRGTLAPSRIDLSNLVRETAALLEVSIGKGARLHLHLPVNLPPVQADATQLRQIVMNLVINAAEAIGDRPGAISVSTFTQTATSADLRRAIQHPDLPGGAYVGLEVRDNGSGIPPDTIGRIFEPFFTTKFSGRGLGLSAVLGIARSHHGALFVESQVGTGTSFRLLLPAASGEALAALPVGGDAATAEPLPQLKGTVLVVDDEDSVREMAVLGLRHAGLEVLEAADGFEALNLCRENSERINLLLLDLTMPNLSGEETLRRLRMQGARQKVILMSGYSANEATRRCQALGAVAFVQKPFELASVVRLIGNHLG